MHATLGRLCEPIGRWSLQVFYLQVVLVLAAYNVPHLSVHSAWQGLVVDVVAVALAWTWSVWRDRRATPRDPAAAPPAAARVTPVPVGVD